MADIWEEHWVTQPDPDLIWDAPLTEEELQLATRLWAQIRYAAWAARTQGVENTLFVVRDGEEWHVSATEASAGTGSFTMSGDSPSLAQAIKDMEESQ